MNRLRLVSTLAAAATVAAWTSINAAGCAQSVDDEPDPTTTPTASGGAGGAAGGAGGQGGAGGSGGDAAACVPVDGVVLALDELFLGDTDWLGTASPSAWEDFGFDLDGITTTGGDLTGHCQPVLGTPANGLNDGTSGIDNAFGRSVLPVFLVLFNDLPQQFNDNINAGNFSLLMLFEGLSAEPDQGPLLTKLYGGALFGSMPAWDGTDCWPVVQEQLSVPTDIESARTQFPTSTLVSNLWSSGSTGTVVIPMNIGSVVAEVRVEHARLTLQMAPSHQGAALGLLGGVLDTEEFVETVRDLFGALNADLCTGSTFDGVATQIRGASDIMRDGSQDPTSTCDGISVGMGFTMLEAGLRDIAPAAPVLPDPCP